MAKLTLREVLLQAIQWEVESRLLYLDLAQRLEDQAIKDACHELAQREYNRQKRLESYLRSGIEERAMDTVDYRIAEYLGQVKISPDMKVDEVFALTVNREQVSHEFYTGLAEIYPDGEVRKSFEEIASQELEDKQRVEHLYVEFNSRETRSR